MSCITRTKSLSPELYAQIMQVWQATGITNPARADSLESIRHNLDNTGTMLYCTEDERVVGAAWVNHDFRRLYIHHMAVLPEYQNRGIGKALLKEALAIAKATGYQAKLEVHQDNPAARHLYSSLGFKDLDGYITMIKREV
jgi:ribosomal protein S18 acetylase RimI-like enzyme